MFPRILDIVFIQLNYLFGINVSFLDMLYLLREKY